MEEKIMELQKNNRITGGDDDWFVEWIFMVVE